jgi:hypothetical protein
MVRWWFLLLCCLMQHQDGLVRYGDMHMSGVIITPNKHYTVYAYMLSLWRKCSLLADEQAVNHLMLHLTAPTKVSVLA